MKYLAKITQRITEEVLVVIESEEELDQDELHDRAEEVRQSLSPEFFTVRLHGDDVDIDIMPYDVRTLEQFVYLESGIRSLPKGEGSRRFLEAHRLVERGDINLIEEGQRELPPENGHMAIEDLE